jgi:hypothetical protein
MYQLRIYIDKDVYICRKRYGEVKKNKKRWTDGGKKRWALYTLAIKSR